MFQSDKFHIRNPFSKRVVIHLEMFIDGGVFGEIRPYIKHELTPKILHIILIKIIDIMYPV